MTGPQEILISLKPKHVESILGGRKTIELRTRRPSIEVGARIWIYAKVPVGAVVGYAIVAKIVTGTPLSIWRRFGSKAGITKSEFLVYFADRSKAHAIALKGAARLDLPVTLKALRRHVRGFHPPQFFSYLNGTQRLLHSAANRSPAAKRRKIQHAKH